MRNIAIVSIFLILIGFAMNEVKAGQTEKIEKVIYNSAEEVQSYYTDGTLQWIYVYEYDATGRKTKRSKDKPEKILDS